MEIWQLQDAKAHLSAIIKGIKKGPQGISVHGKLEAVVLSKREYMRLMKPKPRFVDFMRSSPLMGLRLNISRKDSPTREVEL